MRLYELTQPVEQTIDAPVSNLLTALEMLRQRNYKKINTQSLINLVLNTDQSFSYDDLVNANKNNESVKNLIKSIDPKVIELQPTSSTDSSTDDIENTQNNVTPDDQSMQQPKVDTVKDMATRAAFNRGAPVGIRM